MDPEATNRAGEKASAFSPARLLKYCSITTEYTAKEGFRFFRFDVNPHLVVFFAEKQDMVSEDESNHLIKFKHGINAPDKESSERIEFIKILDDDFIVDSLY